MRPFHMLIFHSGRRGVPPPPPKKKSCLIKLKTNYLCACNLHGAGVWPVEAGQVGLRHGLKRVGGKNELGLCLESEREVKAVGREDRWCSRALCLWESRAADWESLPCWVSWDSKLFMVSAWPLPCGKPSCK